jgi:hypothetical protein
VCVCVCVVCLFVCVFVCLLGLFVCLFACLLGWPHWCTTTTTIMIVHTRRHDIDDVCTCCNNCCSNRIPNIWVWRCGGFANFCFGGSMQQTNTTPPANRAVSPLILRFAAASPSSDPTESERWATNSSIVFDENTGARGAPSHYGARNAKLEYFSQAPKESLPPACRAYAVANETEAPTRTESNLQMRTKTSRHV